MIKLIRDKGFNLYLSVLNPDSKKVVILSHGFLSSKNNFFFRIASIALALRGIRSVRFNYGVEDVRERVRILNKVIDCVAKDSTSIGLLGTSLGGMISIIAARNRKVKSLALINSVYDTRLTYENYSRNHKLLALIFSSKVLKSFFKYDLKRIMKGLRLPTLVVSGGRDKIIPTCMMRELFNDVKARKRLVVLNQAGHALRNPYYIIKASKLIVNWFRSTL